MMTTIKTMLCVTTLVVCLPVVSSHAVVLNQIDAFESDHVENWTSGASNPNPLRLSGSLSGNLNLSGYNANTPMGQQGASSTYYAAVNPKMVIDGFLMNDYCPGPNPTCSPRIGKTTVGQGPIFPMVTVPEGTARLVSFGGAGSPWWHWFPKTNFFDNVSESDVAPLAKSIVNWMHDHGYDGVDVDLEAPALTTADHNKVISLVKNIRSNLNALTDPAPYGNKYLLTLAAPHIGACDKESTNDSCRVILDKFEEDLDWLGDYIDIVKNTHDKLDYINVMSYTMVDFSSDDYEPLTKASTQSYVDLLNKITGGTDGNQKVLMGIPAFELLPAPGTPCHDSGTQCAPITKDLAENLAQDAKDQGLHGVFLWTSNYDSANGMTHYGEYLGNIITGSPGLTGSEDQGMIITSTGTGRAGSKLVAFNKSQWTGDHTAAGIRGILMDLHNAGDTPLNIRLAINGAGGKFSTTSAIALAAQSGWTSALFPTTAGDWTAVSGGADIAATLAGITEVRILSAAAPSWQGETVAAELHVDNIRAIPEPATLGLLAIAALGCLRFRRR